MNCEEILRPIDLVNLSLESINGATNFCHTINVQEICHVTLANLQILPDNSGEGLLLLIDTTTY
jgi:hypothetical protein